ncbi:hypothetical protein CsSME_00015666 [Camellia sinensis var. sinensis]
MELKVDFGKDEVQNKEQFLNFCKPITTRTAWIPTRVESRAQKSSITALIARAARTCLGGSTRVSRAFRMCGQDLKTEQLFLEATVGDMNIKPR